MQTLWGGRGPGLVWKGFTFLIGRLATSEETAWDSLGCALVSFYCRCPFILRFAPEGGGQTWTELYSDARQAWGEGGSRAWEERAASGIMRQTDTLARRCGLVRKGTLERTIRCVRDMPR